MNKIFENYLIIYKSLLAVSKCLTLLSCVYLITQLKNYQMQWNFLQYFMPTIALNINNYLSIFGTIILIIPMTIIILSFIYPENVALKIISGFFSIFGILLNTFNAFHTNTLGEVYNFRLLVVTHIATLQQKREIFIQEFKLASVTISNNITDKLNYLYNQLSETDFIVYDQKLNTITDLTLIKTYATEIVIALALRYDKLSENIPTPYKKYIIGGLILTGTIAAIIFALALNNADTIKVAGNLMLEGGKLSANNNDALSNLASIFKTALTEDSILLKICRLSIANAAQTGVINADYIQLALLVEQNCKDILSLKAK